MIVLGSIDYIVHRLLEAMDSLVDNIPVENGSAVLIPRNTFSVYIRSVKMDEFAERGQFVAASINNTNVTIAGDGAADATNATVSIKLPDNLIELLPNSSNTSALHLSTSFFVTDSLFLRRTDNDKEVGSTIASVRLSTGSIRLIDTPVRMKFLRDPVS